ncbi:MAG: DUF5808 domain-containing protein, partial [Vicinamibacterales bacterium]
ALILAALSILDQVGRSPADRAWHGRVLGVPYDYRVPTPRRLLEQLWSPEDERIILPTVFGVGWTVNFYQLKRRAQLLIA